MSHESASSEAAHETSHSSSGSGAGAPFWPPAEPSKLVDPRVPGLRPNPASLLPWIDADHADTVGASLPAGHQSHEIKVELEKGSVTGAVVLTLEAGKTGLPVGDSLKTFESTSSKKVNGFVSRLETSLMSGELDVEMFEGLSVAIEANALTVGVEGDETDLDLLSVSLKVVGDATKLLGAPAGVTISLDARLTMSLAGKLAAKLASFTAAQLEQKVAAAALEQAGKEAAQHATKVTALKAELSALEKAGQKHYPRAASLRRQIRQGEEFLKNNKKRMGELGGKLSKAKHKAAEAITKLQGKFAKQIAKAMEKKAVAVLAKTLSKIVPVLNLVATIIDIAELTVSLIRILSGETGDGSGDDESETGDGDGASSSNETEPSADVTSEPHDTDGSANGTKEHEPKPGELPPVAKSIVDAITRKGQGPQLDQDQRTMIGLLTSDLTPAEAAEVIARLQSPTSKATSADDVIVAVSNAIKDVRARTRKQTIKVNGVPVSTDESSTDEAKDTEPTRTRGDGPVTSPGQLDAPLTALEIVESGEPAAIARWFEAQGDSLVMSAEGTAWVARYQGKALSAATNLISMQHSARRMESGRWDLSITFKLSVGGTRHRSTHTYFVIRGLETHGIGARHGELTFEPYAMVTND